MAYEVQAENRRKPSILITAFVFSKSPWCSQLRDMQLRSTATVHSYGPQLRSTATVHSPHCKCCFLCSHL